MTLGTDLQCHEEEADNYPGVTTGPAPYGHQHIVCMVTSGHGPPVLRSGSDCNETLRHRTHTVNIQSSDRHQRTSNNNMIARGLLVLVCVHLGSCLEIEVGRSDSNVYPLFLNPFDVTHWKCLGYTV